jgi:diguanylate cyclase (GGDEF)-like protein/PAS domain S-box-containing protein
MNHSRLRILVVDDDEDDYFLTHAILADVYGDQIDVDWVSSYEAAVETLLSSRHGLCLLDYNLGARTGLDLLREVLSRGSRTPIIMLTGNADWELDVKTMEAGAADYLVKGQFGGPHLERSIRYAIGFAVERHQTLDALRRSEERYALAVRGANDGLWDWDLTTDRIYYAPRWKAILGYEDAQIGDSILEWFNRVNPLEVDRVKAEVSNHLAGKTPHLETEHRMLHHDGTYRWVLTRGLAVRNDQGKVVRMAGSQSDITQRKAAEYRLQHDAFHDSLTGLPNRALLLDRLGQAIARAKRRPDSRFGVLFLDIDGFKHVNDSLGHQTGDQLLIAISRRLEGCIREADTVARVGGDEFIGLIDDVETTDVILSLVERILESLRTPFPLDGYEVVLSASIGVALGGTTDHTAEELVRNADIAMYRAKSAGKAGFVVFDEAMHAIAISRLRMESDLRQATKHGQFRLHFQPIVSLRTGQVRSFEALLRWNHPDRGLICPDDFIALAEETKLILPIGLWVIRTAAGQLRKWQREFEMNPPLSISVNLSCRQFLQPDLVEQVQRALLDTGLDPRCLNMEITESAIMEQLGSASSALSKLKSLGIKLAMDDFGKGYSSLSYLHQFPFDTLKIDRSFIASIGHSGENSEIVRAIISLGKGLGLDVVAEGVETQRQLFQLKELGCQFGQGFSFARPLSAEAADALLRDPPQWFDSSIRDVPVTRPDSRSEDTSFQPFTASSRRRRT